jgi:putative ABC transport system ATP-binding protein
MSQPIIQCTDVVRSFGSGDLFTTILKGVSLSVFDGEFVAIMGKSGAGKSTLMYQLSVLDTPTAGSVAINGVDVTKLSEAEQTAFRLHTLGYVFQDYALVLDLNAEENVMIPLFMRGETLSEARRIARQAIDAVGLQGKYGNLPSELSGGEQQRIAIARAVAGKPKIIFADEPTANLDSVSGQAVIDLLGSLHKDGQTIVMVTHEPEYTHYCDRVIEMEDGQIINEQQQSTNTVKGRLA